ncbi:hypothetical protein NNC19_12140 [Clostridium sp. SHJSY1]|uniref:hypothetical protein n=1 Tax=Clostridium sp. SHJSY1 TaxID=2942483 RepID=UPI002874144F|nr:hypothetical protein [Clostridium sp. SHJSY1]MDS0526434.1 hypothetical protein [Clostridium sp. SHJSY1]
MYNREDYTHEDDMDFVDFEFSPVPYESLQREPPFIPIPGINISPVNNYPGKKFPPPDFDYPGGNFNPPGTDFTPPGMPNSPPPNYIPSKKDKGVQSFSSEKDSIGTKAVSPNSIRFCLYKFTYIWEKNGRSYWTFLFNVSRVSVSGFRWIGRNWVYFGLSLNRIDSFVCYRTISDGYCKECSNSREYTKPIVINKKDHYLNNTRDVCTYTLTSLDIPEVKEDSINQTIGYIDDNSITTEIPCVKTRNTSYRIDLEISYPSNYDSTFKKEINNLCDESTADLYKVIYSTRSALDDSTPLENFNASLALIPELLNSFTNSFTSKFSLINSSRINPDITWTIREEKIQTDWKPYFNNINMYN